MKQYLLNIYQPDGNPPQREVLEKLMRDVDAVNQELKAAGAWVFAAGLHPPSTATVIRLRDEDLLLTDGPFAEGKEHIGGVYIITAPDLHAALEWGRKLARATTLPIEVRPFQGELRGERCHADPTHLENRTRVPLGVRSRPGLPGLYLRRHPHRRGGGPGRLHRTGGAQPRGRAGRGRGPAAALTLVDGLNLDGYYLFHVIRAEMLQRLGHTAALAYEAALARTENAAKRHFL